jgi:hypothetical protein
MIGIITSRNKKLKWEKKELQNVVRFLALNKELEETKEKLDDKTKAFEELVTVNQQLHQTSINNNQRSEKWAIQTVLIITKFKLAMKTIQNKLIKNSAAAPGCWEDIFECPVCMENKSQGIQCDNKHKLCLNCSCQHLFTTNQSCPMCRDSYIKDDVKEVAKEAGVKFNLGGGNSVSFDPIVAPIQFDGIRQELYGLFESQ